jgi:hypothetical protein
MADKIFINYRRDDSIGMAGRLHDRLAQTFGRDNLFMDVDHIPVGVDFVRHLNDQVAACDVILVVIGPNWLRAKDKAGQRRLHQPDDFVTIEIAVALARNIRVIPLLVEGARMPRESELPDNLKPLARRQAPEIRHASFGRDVEALMARMREAVGDKAMIAGGREPPGDKAAGRWRVRATIGAVAVVVLLLLIGVGGYIFFQQGVTRVTTAPEQSATADALPKREGTWDLSAPNALPQSEREGTWDNKNKVVETKEERLDQRGIGAVGAEPKPKAEPSILIISDYSINSVAFGPDGRSALSGSDNKKLKLWDLSSGQEIRTFTGHSDRVTSVAFAPDGRTALSGSFDTKVKLWDVASGREIRTFTGH